MEKTRPPRSRGRSINLHSRNGSYEASTILGSSRFGEKPRLTQKPSRELLDNAGQKRKGKGRLAMPWPFQSSITETDVTSLRTSVFGPRPNTAATSMRTSLFGLRATGLPKQHNAETGSVFRDLIPDYVINYMRGETPESVARRNRNGGKYSERGVDISHTHQRYQSRPVNLEGIEDESIRASTPGGYSVGDEERRLTGDSSKPRRTCAEFWQGWRAGVLVNSCLAILTMAIVIACLVVAILRSGAGTANTAIHSGSCTASSSINWLLHAAISVLVVVLVTGANYAFHVLSSPTRTEVDAAHAQGKWLDIGVPSIRNFPQIARSRGVMATVLLVSVVAIQVILNAVTFTSHVGIDANLIFVTESFLQGTTLSTDAENNDSGLSQTDISTLLGLATANKLDNLTAVQCAQQLNDAFQVNISAVLLVTDSKSSSSVLQTAISSSVAQFRDATSVDKLIFDGSAVLYCLAQSNSDASAINNPCDVRLNVPFLVTAAVLNLIVVVVLVVLLCTRSFRPLATLGDALASFLQDPDPTTRRCCLLTKRDVQRGQWGLPDAKAWMPSKHKWLKSASLSCWLASSIAWLVPVGLAMFALVLSIRASPDGSLTTFGLVPPQETYLLPESIPLSAAVLIVNMPQLLLAILYLYADRLMTTYYLSHESSLFVLRAPRPLRVSTAPEGQQTAGIYLTLPRPWSWFLAILFVSASFVLSQSVMVVSITLTRPTGGVREVVGAGFSGMALLLFLLLMLILASAVIGLGGRSADIINPRDGQVHGNPLVLPGGSCSAVLSARCHRVPGEHAVWQQPVAWGVVFPSDRRSDRMDGGHCTYTAQRPQELVTAQYYA